MKIKMIAMTMMIAIATVSCGGSSSDEIEEIANNSDVNWKFGNNTYYSNGISAQSISTSGDFAVVVANSTPDVNLGGFNGSGLTLTLRNLGEGEYYLASQSKVVNNNAKLMYPSITIGTGTNNATLYHLGGDISTNIKAIVTQDSNGKYHVTLKDKINLTKHVIVGTGVVGAADSYELTANNIYATQP